MENVTDGRSILFVLYFVCACVVGCVDLGYYALLLFIATPANVVKQYV